MKGAVSAVLAVVLAVQSGPSTSLRLSFRGPDGETIRPDRVTLLLDWWGGGEALRLSVNATDVVVNLDPKQFEGRWKVQPNEPSRLLIEAKGYASVLSEPFGWPGTTLPTTIQFRDQSITLREGDTREVQLTLRRRQPRALLFVDQFGRPATDLRADIYMFWTRRNHCGVFEGQALRESEAPDRDGRLAIPDGDFDYGVSIFGAAGFVFDQESVFYQRIVKLDGPITTVPVHRLDRRTVTVEITDGSRPIAGAQIVGVDRYTGCMDSGLRPLGATDASGRLTMRNFSFDQFSDVAVCMAGKEIWRGDPEAFRRDVVRISTDPNYVADSGISPCRSTPARGAPMRQR